MPEWYQEEVLEVGGLRFALHKAHIDQAADYLVHLDMNDPTNNADAGTASYILQIRSSMRAVNTLAPISCT